MTLELGASSVTPLLTARSPSISENRVDRLQRVILAAAKQCQRLHEMTLNPPLKVGGLLPIVSQSKLSFIAAAEATPVLNALSLSQKENVGSIIIGPEGDFTETEVKSILEAGATALQQLGLGHIAFVLKLQQLHFCQRQCYGLILSNHQCLNMLLG